MENRISKEATKYAWRAASAEGSLTPARSQLARIRRKAAACEEDLAVPEQAVRKALVAKVRANQALEEAYRKAQDTYNAGQLKVDINATLTLP